MNNTAAKSNKDFDSSKDASKKPESTVALSQGRSVDSGFSFPPNKKSYFKDPSHRYAVIQFGLKTDKQLLRMDTKTGQSWKLIANVWVPVTETKKL